MQPSSCGPLITSGLYSKIRHPIYLFSGLFLLSFLLLTHLWLPYSLLLLLGGLAPVQAVRAMMENHRLRCKFGEHYEEYCRRVWL